MPRVIKGSLQDRASMRSFTLKRRISTGALFLAVGERR